MCIMLFCVYFTCQTRRKVSFVEERFTAVNLGQASIFEGRTEGGANNKTTLLITIKTSASLILWLIYSLYQAVNKSLVTPIFTRIWYSFIRYYLKITAGDSADSFYRGLDKLSFETFL